MELEISSLEEECPKNVYEIELKFMAGDADGYHCERFTFDELRLKDKAFKEELEDFIKTVDESCKLDASGRLGIDSTLECAEWYAGGISRTGKSKGANPKWSKYCEMELSENDIKTLSDKGIELEKTLEGSDFLYQIPYDQNYFLCSYEGMRIYYYDEYGDKYSVEIKF